MYEGSYPSFWVPESSGPSFSESLGPRIPGSQVPQAPKISQVLPAASLFCPPPTYLIGWPARDTRRLAQPYPWRRPADTLKSHFIHGGQQGERTWQCPGWKGTFWGGFLGEISVWISVWFFCGFLCELFVRLNLSFSITKHNQTEIHIQITGNPHMSYLIWLALIILFVCINRL